MSTNGRSPGFPDSLKISGVKSEMASLPKQLENGKRTERERPGENQASSSSPPTASPLSVLPSVRENEFLPSVSRWMTLGGLFMVATVGIALVLAGAIEYKVTVKARATIRPAGELRLVQAATEGLVKDIWVQENQPVKKGDVIVTLDDSRLQTQKSQLQSQNQQAILQLTQLNAQIRAIDTQIFAETNRANRAVASAQAELSRRQREYRDRQISTLTEVQEAQANFKSSQNEWQRARAELKSAEANLRSAEASLKVARKRRARYEKVARAGALSQDRLEEAQIAVAQQEQAVEIQKATIEAQKQTIEQRQQAVRASIARLQRAKTTLNPTQAEVAIASERVAQEKATGEAASAALRREREALLQQRIAIQKQLERDERQLEQIEIDLRNMTISATADGIVARLNLRNSGQTVRSGQEIVQLVPQNTPLAIKAAVSPSDISSVKVGQQVQMQVSACPYPDYGTLPGTVSKISPDTIKSSEVSGSNPATTVNQRTAFYRVMIEPKSLVLGKGKNKCTIQLGMEGRADIISREEPFLQFLLRKARLLVDV